MSNKPAKYWLMPTKNSASPARINSTGDHMRKIVLMLLVPFLLPTLSAAKTLLAKKISSPITIDGQAIEKQWQKCRPLLVKDKVAQIDVTLKALYTDEEIFILVSFPDNDESRDHKTWVWDQNQKIYIMGPDREDAFVFKWNMTNEPKDLSIYADNAYVADIWYWKADRTDPMGHADDKSHLYGPINPGRATTLTSKSGKVMYLKRTGDSGQAAYKNTMFVDFEKLRMPHFSHHKPTGSRADIQAKGQWHAGTWTLEFRRKLKTGYEDDVQFSANGKYQFGISRYEIAGRAPEIHATQPLFGAGDTSESLTIVFEQ